MTPAVAEAWLALTGALRLARGDRGGIDYFNASEEGFWHSFRAAVLCFPLYLILLTYPIQIQIGDATPAPVDVGRMVVVEIIHYVIAWVAFPLLMLPMVDWLRRSDRYWRFMVAYNWCQVPQTFVFAVVALLGGLGVLPVEGVLIGDLVAGIAVIVYEWYVSRVALAVSGGQAALVIVADMLLATILSHVSAALY